MSASNFSVRDAAPSDAPALAALFGELGYPTPAVQMPRRMERLWTDPRARAFVAVEGDALVGAATVHLHTTLHAEGEIAQLTALVVTEARRGSGIGHRLVEAVRQFAVERGCERLYVTTAERRAGAHAFYEGLGWEYTGRRYGITLRTGV